MLVLHRVLAYAIAVLVGVQASSHAWMSAGVSAYIMNGGIADRSMMEDTSGALPFIEVIGAIVHSVNGSMVIPVVALALLVVSFFVRTKGAIIASTVTLVLVAAQILMGFSAHAMTWLGAVHGLNALAIFTCALVAARTTGRRATPVQTAPAAENSLV